MGRWAEVTQPEASGSKHRGAGTNKGAARRLKALKRKEAMERNARTPYVRTAAYRREQEDAIQVIASLGNLEEIFS